MYGRDISSSFEDNINMASTYKRIYFEVVEWTKSFNIDFSIDLLWAR
jgi:hypothetical protein